MNASTNFLQRNKDVKKNDARNRLRNRYHKIIADGTRSIIDS